MTAHLLEFGAAMRISDEDDLARCGRRASDRSGSERTDGCELGREAGAAGEGVLLRVQQAIAPLLDWRCPPPVACKPSHACA